ncbi:MAG: magnesium transporter, partial [Clostridia bacterium]|nr:magnesium transporter [Clostridia bacterium]
EDDALIEDIMESNPIYVTTLEDKEVVAYNFDKYNFLALPVVDEEQRMVGIVTFDDAIDVLQDEAAEDMEMMAAIVPNDRPYMKTGVFETWRKRIPWLILLMLLATFTGMIMSGFEDALKAQIILTSFIPMIMNTAGNSGSQSSVTIIHGLSVGEIDYRDTLRIVWKEIRVALLCGATLAVAIFVKCTFVDRLDTTITLVISLTLVFAVFFAKLIGCLLPIGAKRIGFDPAVMASPFITTIVDALSLLVYFSIACAFLDI